MESTPKPKPRRGRPPLNRPPRPKVVKKNGRPKKPEIGILDERDNQALESKHSFVNRKVADLTPEQREIRREYFRIANIHYRARKKLEREALEMT